MRVLLDKVRSTGTVSKIDFAFTRDVIMSEGRCTGAVVCQQALRKLLIISARAVVLATGGAGQLYARTTNPAVSTGDGMAMAYRAGAALVDMEFVQFHPTALFLPGSPQFLLSEAMRGEGGMLRNVNGVRFMDRYHPSRELAPRDIVTRAIHSEMDATGSDHVFLDMTHLNAGYITQRFPRIYRTCKELDIDISAAPIPVSPAAHYIMGGVKTDLWGATSIPGLFTAGETACTGVHGANRLASNSLLEGLVFGERAGLAAARYARKNILQSIPKSVFRSNRLSYTKEVSRTSSTLPDIRSQLKRFMWEKVGIVRNKKDLSAALKKLREWDSSIKVLEPDRSLFELKNMITSAMLITRSALKRQGSVGAHFRNDFPSKGKNWRKRTVLTK
jgi:L-aspartate oxidase